jgi:hypothetical protein
MTTIAIQSLPGARLAFLALPPVSFDFTTAAVVSFVLMLLGLAAGLIVMIRLANRQSLKRGE